MEERSRRRPIFKEPSEIARAWAEALRAELEQWPGVRILRSFGMMIVYRGEVVFAALAGSRMLHAEDAIMLKFNAESAALARRIAGDPRFEIASLKYSRNPKSEGRKWRIFVLRGDPDVHAALEWLAEAYKGAKGR